MADGKRLRRETFFQILLDAHDCLGLLVTAAAGRNGSANQSESKTRAETF